MRILFITATRIGDATLSTATLEALRVQYPHARFTIACGAIAAPLFAEFPALEALIPLTKHAYAGHWVDLWRATVGTRWDMVVDLRGSLLGYFLRAKERIRFKGKQPSGGSMAHQWSRCAGFAGTPLPALWWGDATAKAAESFLAALPSPVLALAPAANWPPKEWPLDSFIALINALESVRHKEGKPPLSYLVVAAPAEAARMSPLVDALPANRTRMLAGEMDLLGVAAALSRCAGFIGNDSGLMHIAAAVGIPTLGLFGPTNEALYAPVGSCAAFLRAPDGDLSALSVTDVTNMLSRMLNA
jgi:heptosyltransferase-3